MSLNNSRIVSIQLSVSYLQSRLSAQATGNFMLSYCEKNLAHFFDIFPFIVLKNVFLNGLFQSGNHRATVQLLMTSLCGVAWFLCFVVLFRIFSTGNGKAGDVLLYSFVSFFFCFDVLLTNFDHFGSSKFCTCNVFWETLSFFALLIVQTC